MQNIDKLYHFLAGVGISLVLGYFLGVLLGIMLTLAVAVGKEVYDYYVVGHTSDWLDVTATMVGSFIGYVVLKEIIG